MKKEDKSIVIEQLASTITNVRWFYITDLRLSCRRYQQPEKALLQGWRQAGRCEEYVAQEGPESLDTDFEPIYGSLKGNSALMPSISSERPRQAD